MYLAAAGIGKLILADFDTVELSNLQRQIAHGQADIGRLKVESAADTLKANNPDVETVLLTDKMEGHRLDEAVARADVMLDYSDNFALNDARLRQRKPLVSGAAIRFEGQVAVYDSRREDSPCYRCLYREEGADDATCVRNGVLAPLVGVIGSLQAVEAIKLLLGIGEPLVGRLMLYDALSGEMRALKLRKDPACPACGEVCGTA